MRRTLFSLPLLAALAGSAPAVTGCSDVTGPGVCQRPDEGTPCGSARSVEPTDRGYVVITRTTTAASIGYVDRGVQCVFTRFGCEERYCYVDGARSPEEALAFCE